MQSVTDILQNRLLANSALHMCQLCDNLCMWALYQHTQLRHERKKREGAYRSNAVMRLDLHGEGDKQLAQPFASHLQTVCTWYLSQRCQRSCSRVPAGISGTSATADHHQTVTTAFTMAQKLCSVLKHSLCRVPAQLLMPAGTRVLPD